jgi:hypothetical protein
MPPFVAFDPCRSGNYRYMTNDPNRYPDCPNSYGSLSDCVRLFNEIFARNPPLISEQDVTIERVSIS